MAAGRAPRTCLALALALVLAGCGGSGSEAHEKAVAAARASLAATPGNPSEALFKARDAIAKQAERSGEEDPRLDLIAAEACLQLDRRSEALEYATTGLTAADLEPDLRADLFWASGAATMGRYHEMNDEGDWRTANSLLEKATEAGHHQVDAAMALVGLQDLGNHRNDERKLKYARLVIALDKEGTKAQLVRRLLESQGLKP